MFSFEIMLSGSLSVDILRERVAPSSRNPLDSEDRLSGTEAKETRRLLDRQLRQRIFL